MPSCHRGEEATVTDNFLGMPSDCVVTARCADLGIGLTSSHVKVSFDVGCCEFVFISRGYYDAARSEAKVEGRITVHRRSRVDSPSTYMSWRGTMCQTFPAIGVWLNDLPEEVNYFSPVGVSRPYTAGEKRQLAHDVHVPLDDLDKFVITGFAGQLWMWRSPHTSDALLWRHACLPCSAHADGHQFTWPNLATTAICKLVSW